MSGRVDSPLRKLEEALDQALPQIAAIADKDERASKFRETMAHLGVDDPIVQREMWREMCYLLPTRENPYIEPDYRKRLLRLLQREDT